MNNNLYNRPAFTMIELIFIILIVGILAAVAIPRLMTNRNDALLAVDVSNMGLCIEESAAYYTVHGSHVPTTGYSDACDDVQCYITSTDRAYFIVETNSTTEIYCANIEKIGGHLAKKYRF